MPDPADLTDAENWNGGFYELFVEFGDTDDARLEQALRSLWAAAGVRGHATIGSGYHREAPLTAGSLLEHGHLRGVVRLPDGPEVVCGCYPARWDGTDRFGFYLPLGALARVDRRIGAFPFDENSGPESLVWRDPLDRWLARVATTLYAQAPFRCAVIGFEVDADLDPATLLADRPEPQREAFLVPSAAGLSFLPATA